MKFGNITIGGMSFGSVKVGGARYGSTLVYRSGGSPSTAVPYIRGGADGSYIDTGITPDQTTKVIVWARNWNPSSAAVFLFGSRIASNNAAFLINTMSGANTGKIRFSFANANTDISDGFNYLSNYHKYEVDGNTFSVDDVVVGSSLATTFSNEHSIHLIGYNNGGNHADALLPIDISACKIYKGGNLVRDFIAVNSPSVGLYDLVSETLFTNAGTGSFTYGTFNPDAYTPLEYITTGGDSYFLTSVIGGYDTRILARFMPTGTTATNYDVLGGRGSTERLQIFTGNTTYRNARLYGMLGSGTVQTIYSSNTNDYLKNKDIVVIKTNNTFSAYYNYAALGSTITYSDVASSYSTGEAIMVGASKNASGNPINKFVGRINYIYLGGLNLVPANVNNVAGMYDTYGDVFYPSTSETPFTAGTTI